MSRHFPPADQVELGHYELSSHLLALELMRRGHKVRWLNRGLFTSRVGDRTIGFWCTRSPLNSTVGAKIAIRKDMAAKVLHSAGLPVARGAVFRELEKAQEYMAELGVPVVVKPLAGTKGKGVTVGITHAEALASAWETTLAAQRPQRRVIVEEAFTGGSEARFLVVGDRCIAVYGKRPPMVTGDGRSTIRELIDAKNEARRQNPHLRRRPVLMNDHRERMLREQGYGLDGVPPTGVELLIDRNANVSAGADSIDLTDKAHPTLADAAIRAAHALPGLSIAGVDLITRDIGAPATPDNYVVVEVNSMPALGAHHFPWEGTSRDAAAAVIDLTLERLGAPGPGGDRSKPGFRRLVAVGRRVGLRRRPRDRGQARRR